MINKLLQKRPINKKHIFLFLVFWLITNVLQAFFTNLHYDEAYYWYYSLNLDWGYFDHPPMVALMAKLGDTLFHSRLSVRLMSIFMGLFVMWQLINYLKKDADNLSYLLLFLLVFPFISLHSAGFLLLPDAPLVFFFMLYLWAYRRFLKNDNWFNIILLSFFSAAMMYSKYHGAIVILLTILSNLKLLKNYRFWIVGIVSIVMFTPHLYWQYDNGFPTFQYHLSDRGSGFEWANLLNYIGSQIVLSGLLAGIIIVGLTFKYFTKNQFEKTLKYIAVGFWVFFLFACLKGQVEAHWTSTSMIAVIILSFKSLKDNNKLKKTILYLIIPSVILLFLARILLASDTLANQISIKSDFHNYNSWNTELDSLSDDKPILFTGGYQDVSRYGFYKNRRMPYRPHWWTRVSQYDSDLSDTLLAGKTVFALDYRNDIVWESKNRNTYKASILENYYPYYNLKIEDETVCVINDSIFFLFALKNTSGRDFEIMHDSIQRLCIINLAKDEKNIIRQYLNEINTTRIINKGTKIPYRFFIKPDDGENKLYLHIILYSAGLRVSKLRPQEFTVVR